MLRCQIEKQSLDFLKGAQRKETEAHVEARGKVQWIFCCGELNLANGLFDTTEREQMEAAK